ncbi:hypothetical protein SLS56_009678 [Neofusicoccum ribis]|uniref:Uncharacterized protein n=1 Tax=Neofusicoccum ribis TaxID=45134 RepID=A0ABR3SGM9_9PEZI
MAFSNKALMHGLLALSALHYGHTHPDQREPYQILSTRHQSIAIDSLSRQLHSINQDNCQAAILLAALIFIIKTFSISDQYNHGSPVTIPDLAQSFLLLQGTILTIPHAYQHAAAAGPLAPLLTRVQPSAHPAGPFVARLDRLLALARTVFAHGPDALDARAALVLAVEALRHACAVLQAADPPPGRVWAWGVGVPAAFLDMLGRGSVAALAVLVHFAALVERAEGRRWHVRGWAEGVVEAVERGLEAGMGGEEEGAEEWKRLVGWPVRCVREGIDIMSVAEEGYGGVSGEGG